MAAINGNEQKLAYEQTTGSAGANWGTVEDITSGGALARVSSLSLNASHGSVQPNDNGFDNFINAMIVAREAITFSTTHDLSHNGAWPAFLAALMGGISTSSEVTPSQGDYDHTLTMASSIYKTDCFFTLAYMLKTDQSLEFPSAIPTSAQISFVLGQIPTITFNWIADTAIIGSASNTAAEIAALSYAQTHEYTAWGTDAGGDDYVRSNATGGGSLSSSDDKCVESLTINIDRGLQPEYCLRGANSKYTVEPRQYQKTNITVSVKKINIDDDWDLGTIWESPTAGQKLAVAHTGGQIGTGTDKKTLFEFNNLVPQGALASPYGIQAGSKNDPEMVFQAITSASAPTGMSGLTNGCRATITSEYASAYISL